MSGPGFPLRLLPVGGRLSFPTEEESVRQSIEVILRTARSELRWHPEFGAGIDQALHEPNTVETHRALEARIRDALRRWESRIDVLEVEASEDARDPAQVRVALVYRLRRGGGVRHLGMTVEPGA